MQGWELVDRNDKKSYEATQVGSEIVRPFLSSHLLRLWLKPSLFLILRSQTFNAFVTEGQLGLFVWKTPAEGFGRIICWVDDDQREERKITVKSFTSRTAASFEHTGNMFKDLAPGNHTLTCRLKAGDDGGTTFRISAVVAR
jgi:alpha-ketoglutarate-dependent taurine dioxygenase